MKTTRSLALVAAGALGISLIVAPLGYAAEATRGATPTVQRHNVSMTHRGHVTKHRRMHRQGVRKHHQHLRMATQTEVQSVS
jgi:hypothetical protein